jgi:hypothetical protein
MSNFIILFLAFLIPATELARRYLVVQKFKSMFPEKQHRFAPPLFDIDFRDVPHDTDGENFRKYFKKMARFGLLFVLICAGLIYLIGNVRPL